MPEIDQSRCAYCLKYLGSEYLSNWIWFHIRKWKDPQIIFDTDPNALLKEIRAKVCNECAEDMGIRFDPIGVK